METTGAVGLHAQRARGLREGLLTKVVPFEKLALALGQLGQQRPEQGHLLSVRECFLRRLRRSLGLVRHGHRGRASTGPGESDAVEDRASNLHPCPLRERDASRDVEPPGSLEQPFEPEGP